MMRSWWGADRHVKGMGANSVQSSKKGLLPLQRWAEVFTQT